MTIESSNPIVAKPRLNPVAQYMLALAAVIGAYSIYVQFAVPVLEGPHTPINKRAAVALDELPSPREQKLHLVPLLPADAWELTACKTLLIDAGTILFKEIEQQADGSLQIVPFTLISGLESDSLAGPTSTQPGVPTVLRCLAGAKLKFNKPFREIFSGTAKMESARLSGRVDIYRPPTQPDRDDAMHVVTSNVQIDKHRVYTLEQIQFAFGPNEGSGRNMVIDLEHNTDSSVLSDFSSIAGIRRLELAFLDKLRVESTKIQPTSADGEPVNSTSAQEPSADNTLFSAKQAPLEITCKGAFVFDFRAKTASFQKQVVAEQVDQFRDNIQCDELILVFEDKSRPIPRSKPGTQPLIDPVNPPRQKPDASLQLKRFIANGSPATVISRSRSAKITGESLTYNILTGQFDGSCQANNQEMVTIVSPEYQVVAKQLAYLIADDGSLGEIDVTGPGRLLRIGAPEKGDFYTAWKKGLTTRDVPGQPGLLRVIIDGSAEVRVADDTSIAAEKLDLMVWRLPKLDMDKNRKPSWEYLPSKLVTSGDVTIVSPKLDGEADHLTATWPAPANQGLNPTTQFSYRAGYRGIAQHQTNVTTAQQNSNQQLSRIPRRAGAPAIETNSVYANGFSEPVNSSKSTGFVELTNEGPHDVNRDRNVRPVGFELALPSKPANPKHKLKFKGETVDVRLTETGDSTEIRDLTVVGNVSIISVPAKPPGNVADPSKSREPLTIHCHRLQLTPQSGEGNYRTLISGKNGGFATVSAKDFELTGQNINLDQTANKVWVEGAGSLKMKTETSPQQPANDMASQFGDAIKRQATPENLDVSWKGGMIFDGAKIYFENEVEMSADRVSGEGTHSNTRSQSEGLSVELSKPVQFQNLQTDEKIGAAKVRELILVEQVPEAKQVFKMVSIENQSEPTPKRPVVIENRNYDANGDLNEQQRIVVPQAVINVESGAMEGKGPGTISTHRKSNSSSDLNSNPLGQLAGPVDDQDSSGITFIQINFDGAMTVDANRHQMILDRKIRTVYTPVQNWDVFFDPDRVPKRVPGMVFLNCENLQLAQWAPRGMENPTSELIATGNSHIRSDTVEATADRVSYDQASDTLVIVGTSRNDAKFALKQTPNDQDPNSLVAKKFTYRPKDKVWSVFGLKSGNANSQ